MRIGIATDHGGFGLKEDLLVRLKRAGHEVVDFGAYSLESSDDYPDFVIPLARSVAAGNLDRGVAVCGSGVGASIAANKVPGVRAAVAWNEETARLAREHNDANVLALGARTTPVEKIPGIVRAWFNAKFGAGHHERRVEKIREIEREELAHHAVK